MRSLFVSLLVVAGALPVAARSAEPSPPRFATLKEAVDFIAERLDRGDHDRLAAACTGRADVPPQVSPHVLEALKARHGQTRLPDLYTSKDFPAEGDRFTLGGHDRELGHIHIVFRKEGAVWLLEDIFLCR